MSSGAPVRATSSSEQSGYNIVSAGENNALENNTETSNSPKLKPRIVYMMNPSSPPAPRHVLDLIPDAITPENRLISSISTEFDFDAGYVVNNKKVPKYNESMIRHRNGIINVDYPIYLTVENAAPQVQDENGNEIQSEVKEGSMSKEDGSVNFHIAENVNEYNAVVRPLLANGFRRSENAEDSHIYWGKTNFLESNIIWDRPFQRVNHFPGSLALGNKSTLAINLESMKQYFGPMHVPFLPETYILPLQTPTAQKAIASSSGYWIYKPSKGSCGNGIQVISESLSNITATKKAVLSKYIDNPLLVNGYKFDLRLYVLVTSYDPLRIYLLDDGLVRFATEKYDNDQEQITNLRKHLTNFSINKAADDYYRGTQYSNRIQGSVGSKWTFKALKFMLEKIVGADTSRLMGSIHDVIIKTLMSVESDIVYRLESLKAPRFGCFELYGFDVMLDDTLKPWLIEVNLYPSLSSGSLLDKAVKTKCMCDLFHMLRLPAVNPEEGSSNMRKAILDKQSKSFSSERAHDLDLLQSLPELNYEYLSTRKEDQNLLREFFEENSRRRHFERIYPASNPVLQDYYGKLFRNPRYNNILQNKFLLLSYEKQTELIQSFQSS